MKSGMTRRAFLRTSTWGAGLLVLPSSKLAFGYSANDKLNIAGIGVGGRGRDNLNEFSNAGENIVALCDVDGARAGDIYRKHPQAKTFTDFRRMFDAMDREIDAVLVATPDHTHAVAAVAAMQHGKHVYCEKPLTRTVHEARVMRETARAHKVVTQMGNQGSASDGLRRGVELVWDGAIGEVREAHVWFDGGNGPMRVPTGHPTPPATLDWNLWLGPAPERPYNPCYAPSSWRNWRAFGSGIVGDFGCHTGNLMFRALRLEQLWEPPGPGPERNVVRVEAKPSEVDLEGYPTSMVTTVDLPARGSLPPVKLTLYAKDKPSENLLLGHPRGGWGDLLVGTKCSLYSDCPWNTRIALLPRSQFPGFKSGPPQKLPKPRGHQQEWLRACKGDGQTFSSFDIGGPLTELMQLVNLATLIQGPVEYDTLSGRILNSAPAGKLLHRKYRSGWVI